MSGEGGGEGGGKLPSVDHGRRTDEGRDKKERVDSSNSNHFYQFCYPGQVGDEGRWIEVDDSLHAQIW